MILFLPKLQCNIGLIPFAYTLRLESESEGTEVTLTSSKYLSFYSCIVLTLNTQLIAILCS